MKTKQSKKICQVCEKEFYVKPYRKNVAKFCSHKCYAISLLDVESKRKTGRYIGCKYCNKKFWVQPNEEKINRKYCSSICYHTDSLGKKLTEETLKKIKGNIPWNITNIRIKCKQCNKEFKITPCEFQSNIKYCSKKCYSKAQKIGEYKKCKICNKKFWAIPSEKRKYCSTYCYHKNNKGKNNPNWKDNKATGIVEQIRSCLEYKAWRLSVFERDNFICQMPECDKIERILNTHHITIFSQILQDNNIKTIEQALECKELWDINNGITLCRKCHQNIIKKESQYENLFKEIVKLKQYGK